MAKLTVEEKAERKKIREANRAATSAKLRAERDKPSKYNTCYLGKDCGYIRLKDRRVTVFDAGSKYIVRLENAEPSRHGNRPIAKITECRGGRYTNLEFGISEEALSAIVFIVESLSVQQVSRKRAHWMP